MSEQEEVEEVPECPACEGTGYEMWYGETCVTCGGAGEHPAYKAMRDRAEAAEKVANAACAGIIEADIDSLLWSADVDDKDHEAADKFLSALREYWSRHFPDTQEDEG